MTKASDKIVEILIEAGVEYIFGVPGGGTMPVWNSLYDHQDEIKIILTRHEQAAACMADAYGRITGKPAVLMGQGAFIVSNGAFGILESYLYGSPMLVITDTSDGGISQHGTYQSGTAEYGSYDIVSILRGMSKFTTYAVTPEEAAHGVQLAIKHAITGRPGPASVLMRNRAALEDVNPACPPKIYPTSKYLHSTPVTPLPGEIQKACKLILDAQRPVIIAGSGVHNSKAYKELEELAELLGIPVATSYRGKSAFAEINPLALGMIGNFGQKVANDTIADADLLLVAGCRLSPSDTKYEDTSLIDPQRQKIVQIDIDPRSAGWVFPAEMCLAGDLKIVLKQLLDSIKGMTGDRYDKDRSRVELIIRSKKKGNYFDAPEKYLDTMPIAPQRLVKEIEEVLDENALITLDAGDNRLWMGYFYKSKAPGTVLCPGGIAGMGWSPPAALAVKLLNPDKTVLSVSGDGGFAMVINVLSTAVQYQLPVVFLIMNNSCLGMVRDGQLGKPVACEFIDTDFAAVARAFGCKGVRVEKPAEIGPAIKEAIEEKLPTVLDVITDPNESSFKIMS